MGQKDTVQDKCATKDTPGIAQYCKSVEQTKKHQQENKQKKQLNKQGVGLTIPASRKQNTQSEQPDVDELSDEDYDKTLAEIQAEEAWKLKTMDEQELQRLWDKGSAKKVGSKVLTSAASQPANAKVKPIGPSQQILAPLKSSSTGKGSLGKRKHTSSPDQSTPKPQGTKHNSNKKLSSSRWESTNANVCSMDDSEDGSSGEAGLAMDDKDNGNSDMGNGDGNGNGNDSRDKSKSGKGGWGKTSNFTGAVKKMIDYTTIRVCAKLVSSGMFIPPHKYKALVSKSWVCAAAEYGVDTDSTKYKLQKWHKQAIRACINSFWSQVRDRLKPAIASVYKLLAEGHTPNEAKEYIQSLFPHAYHTKVGAPPGTRHFQHSFLEEAIFELYYTRNNPVGIAYEKWFDPMPLEAIGFVCAVVRPVRFFFIFLHSQTFNTDLMGDTATQDRLWNHYGHLKPGSSPNVALLFRARYTFNL
ncbi:hypothetical protein RHS04_07683, partial [Rhizoctonia solani]